MSHHILSLFFVVFSALAIGGDNVHFRVEYASEGRFGLEGHATANDELEWVVQPLGSPSMDFAAPIFPNDVDPCPEGVLDVDNDGVCDNTDLCTDITACNYDGSENNAACNYDYDSCAGCMSQLACNFKATATLDDGSCVFANDACSYCSWDTLDASSVNGQNPQDGSGTLIGNNVDGDTFCDLATPVALTPDTLDNCYDTDMCNYMDPNNGSCTTPTEYYYDADGDSLGEYSLGFFCGTEVPEEPHTDYRLPGEWDDCIDQSACNYDNRTHTNAACQADRDDDGLCDGVESIDGAGVKSYSVDLCVDGQAPNYDNSDTLYVNAGTHNEPCCIDDNGNGVCDDREVFGCTDSYACNYVSFANLDDGSCEFVGEETELSSNSTEQYATSIDQSNNYCGECLTNGDSMRVSNTALTLLGYETLTVGSSTDSTTIKFDLYVSNDSDGDGVCDADEQVGCADSTACNYAEDAFGNDFPLATLGDGSEYIIVRTLANGETISDSVFVTEPCYYDEDLLYGVTAAGDSCDLWCKTMDACDVCGGGGVDIDADDICDDSDNCKLLTACNYDDSANEACKFYTESQCSCVSGSDLNEDGYVDDAALYEKDADNDGVCDGPDLCEDLLACNYDANPSEACMYLNSCGNCVTGVDGNSDGYVDTDASDSDGDGLCDTDDACTNTSACNWDYRVDPLASVCEFDADGNGTCDPYEIYGCTTATACNYNSTATKDDGSCVSASAVATACEVCAGSATDGTGYVQVLDADGDSICDDLDNCSDLLSVNFADPNNAACCLDTDENGICDTAETLGCMNPSACNYDASATRDNGACLIKSMCQLCDWDADAGGTGTNPNDGSGTRLSGDIDMDGVCDVNDNCTDVTACNYVGGLEDCVDPLPGRNCFGDCLVDVDNDGICDHAGADLCTDLEACNFDASEGTNATCVYRNTCNVCGDSIPDVPGYDPLLYCDCELHVLDSAGVCGGTCMADVDNDGICDDVDPCLVPGEVPDYCGVCGGNVTLENLGQQFECGCFDRPANACDCDSTGQVVYAHFGEDCDGNCLYGETTNSEGETICVYYDNAEITSLPNPVSRKSEGNRYEVNVVPEVLGEWLNLLDTLHSRMSKNLDDGSLTGASERLTIEHEILDKGDLNVVGNTQLSGEVQMDSNVVILGDMFVNETFEIIGTTFSKGGMETENMDIGGDVNVGGAAVINSTLDVRGRTTLHDSLQVSAPISVESTSTSNLVFSVDTLGNSYIGGVTRIADSLFATAAGTRLAGLVADSTLLTRLEVSGTSVLHNDVQMNDNLLIHDSLVVERHVDLSEGASLTVSGASNFNSLITATGDIENHGLITTDSIISDTLRSTLGSITRLEATTLEVNSREERALFRGGLSAVNAADYSVFSVRATDDNMGKLALSGTMDIYSSVVDPSGTNPAPTDTVTINGSQGLLNATGWIKGSSFEAKFAGGLSRLRGSLQVDSLTTLTKGLNVFHTDTASSNALLYVQNSGIELKRNTSLAGNLTLGNGNRLTLGTSGVATAASNLFVYGKATIDSLTVNGRIDNGSNSLTTGSGTFAGGVTVSDRLDVTNSLVVGRRASYNYETNDTTKTFIAVFDAGGGLSSQTDGIVIRVDNGSSQPDKTKKFIQLQNKKGQIVGEMRGYSTNADKTRDMNLKIDEKVVETSFASLQLADAALGALWSTLQFTKVIPLKMMSKAVPDAACCSFLLPIGCFIIPIPGIPTIDWADMAKEGAKTAVMAHEVNASKKKFTAAVKNFAQAVAFQSLQSQVLEKDRGDFGGIAFASGNRDYAEWIPLNSSEERLSAGYIVGIRDGKVSLRTEAADHLMVVSNAPIVTGNDSPQQIKNSHEKIAFMGQVPVKVIGSVASGDYILPSGENDGYGRAVSKEDLNPKDISQIVGVAWEAGHDVFMNTVNVAVGLEHNAEADLFNELENQMDELAYEMSQFRATLLGQGTPAVHEDELRPNSTSVKPSVETASAFNGSRNSLLSNDLTESHGSVDEQYALEAQASHLPQFHLDQTADERDVSVQEQFPEQFVQLLEENFGDDFQALEDIEMLVRSLNHIEPVMIPMIEASLSSVTADVLKDQWSNYNRLTPIVREAYAEIEGLSIVPGSKAEKLLIQQVREACSEAFSNADLTKR